jgi:hypothetical protein
MRTVPASVVSLVFTLMAASARSDVTHSCANPPNRAARVAVKDNVAVGKTQDRNSGTCTFFKTALIERAVELANCLKGFFSGGAATFPLGRGARGDSPTTPQQGRGAAVPQPRGSSISCGTPAPTSIQSGEAKEYVEVSVTWGNGRFVTSLLVPRKYPSLPPLRSEP